MFAMQRPAYSHRMWTMSCHNTLYRVHRRKQTEATKGMAELRGFQHKLLDHIKQGGNHIIVAPTGSGKTRIAVELSALWLAKKSTARTLFLTNTVPLAQQQAGNLLKIMSSGLR